MSLSASDEGQKSGVIRSQMLQISVGEGVARPKGGDGLEGVQVRSVVTTSLLELDVDGRDVRVDGVLGLLSGSESTGGVAVPLKGGGWGCVVLIYVLVTSSFHHSLALERILAESKQYHAISAMLVAYLHDGQSLELTVGAILHSQFVSVHDLK